MIVKRGVKKPPPGSNQSESHSISQEQPTSDDILGTQGLELFIKPGGKYCNIV
jgi:hypothetical protein